MTDLLPNLKLKQGSLPDDVLVCGDPARAETLAEKLDDAREVAWNREYHTFTGYCRSVPVAVCSHGVGAAGAAVCFEELILAGARRLIRVGTAGSLSPAIGDGNLVIATAAVREDRMSEQLVPLSYPAVADRSITDALEQAAAGHAEGIAWHSGIILTVGAFYPGILDLPNKRMAGAGVIAVEMECSALFVLASLRGVQAGAILAIDGPAADFDAKAYNPHRGAVTRAVAAGKDIALAAVVLNGSDGR